MGKDLRTEVRALALDQLAMRAKALRPDCRRGEENRNFLVYSFPNPSSRRGVRVFNELTEQLKQLTK